MLAELTNSTAPAHHRVAITKRRAKRATGWTIFPGTKWCGPRNKAAHNNELGALAELDKCCRTHDKCDVCIKSWRSKYGKFNWYMWTVSHCNCDDVFRQCLRNVGWPQKIAATSVEHIYFSFLGVRCFLFDDFLGIAYYRD
ncbi:hypothetical protein V1264_004856 [Littorina saxatilis]|uniref:Phospholipase A2-like central domain-containing protein n=2 Tax=Littorina saxatilis TaxID=31220 RepID=A0AAN9G728_9CAEN